MAVVHPRGGNSHVLWILIGSLPESLTQGLLVGKLLVGGLGVVHPRQAATEHHRWLRIVAIFYPFSQFREIGISLLSLQTQPNTPNLFQRGVRIWRVWPSLVAEPPARPRHAREPEVKRYFLVPGGNSPPWKRDSEGGGLWGSGSRVVLSPEYYGIPICPILLYMLPYSVLYIVVLFALFCVTYYGISYLSYLPYSVLYISNPYFVL